MSRINKLETHYKKQLEDKNVENISTFIKSIIDVDITKGKYARFLIEAFLNDKFLEEDLVGGLNSTVGQAISLFDKHKHKLPVHERSVYALDKKTQTPLYQSPGDLWNSVKQYQGELSGKELKREEQEQVYRETEFVYKDEETGFQIISPLTKESAQWWGKGTRWCTSAEKNNMFYNYAKDAPLLILLIPDNIGNGDKLQLWNNNDDIQFMDENDNRVSLEYIEQHWSLLEPICLWLNTLKYIPLLFKTKELCKLAIQRNGLDLRFVPENFKTKELFKIAVKQNGMTLDYIPEDLRTKELCELAVIQNGWALEFVPDKYKTKELCAIAVQNNGWALLFVPSELKTKEMCELAVKNDGRALDYVPKEHKDYNFCMEAIKNNGKVLQWVPEEYKKELQHYVKNEILELEIPLEQYKNIFQEIKTFFPQKDISLQYNHV